MLRALKILVVIGALAGLYAGLQRHRVEARNRRVEIAVDLVEVRELAQVTGASAADVLARLRQAGASSAAVAEDTLATLETTGRVTMRPTADGAVEATVPADLLRRLPDVLRARGIRTADPGTAPTRLAPPAGADGAPLGVALDYGSLRTRGLGADPAAVAEVRAVGLAPVVRLNNPPGATQAMLTALLGEARDLGAHTVICSGTEVLGYRTQLREAAEAFSETGVNYGQVEFGKQKGDDGLSRALRGAYVRVHSISEAEAGTLDGSTMVERYVRAARERNIRLCYVRLASLVGPDPVGGNAAYIEAIRSGVTRNGEARMGLAHQFDALVTPAWVHVLIALAVAAGAAWLAASLAPVCPIRLGVWFAAGALVLAALCLTGDPGRKAAALAAALIFPTLACLRRDMLTAPPEREAPAPPLTRAGAAAGGVRALLAATAVTLAGVLCVVGLLAHTPFLVKAAQFAGIKLAHALPILAIGAAAVVGLPALAADWPTEVERLRRRLGALYGAPARIGPMLAALVALVGLAVAVARTGNEPGVGVSAVELRARSVMDRVLVVRPRTKEFLIGHPALVVGVALYLRRRRAAALPLLVVGAVGQVSVLNTFCHIHTPLILSALRAAIGLVLGAGIGVAAFLALDRLLSGRATPAVTAAAPDAVPCGR